MWLARVHSRVLSRQNSLSHRRRQPLLDVRHRVRAVSKESCRCFFASRFFHRWILLSKVELGQFEGDKLENRGGAMLRVLRLVLQYEQCRAHGLAFAGVAKAPLDQNVAGASVNQKKVHTGKPRTTNQPTERTNGGTGPDHGTQPHRLDPYRRERGGRLPDRLVCVCDDVSAILEARSETGIQISTNSFFTSEGAPTARG